MLVSNVMIIVECEILLLLVRDVGVECDAAVHEFILAALVPLERLAPDLLLTVYQPVLVPMMIEVYLADTAINLNDFLPIVGGSGAVVVLNQFELVRESSAEDEIVFAVLIVAANLIDNESLKVLVNDHTAY